MASDARRAITNPDVRNLAAKLKGLYALLTPGEQALLHTVLHRAAGCCEAGVADTDGIAWAVSFNPFAYLDAIGREAWTEGGSGGGAASEHWGEQTRSPEQAVGTPPPSRGHRDGGTTGSAVAGNPKHPARRRTTRGEQQP
jgi:hypothetical protein